MSNKLLLVEDVASLGKKGELVSVKPGYARNFLLPKRKAVIADAHTLRMQARLQEERAKQAAADKKDAEVQSEKLTEVTLVISVKVDHDGHMYGSVTPQIVSDHLKEKEGFVLEPRSIQIKPHIKKTGIYDIPVHLSEGVIASISLTVEPEETEEKAAE